ncbi:uncharacterized protein SPPG_08646 [Spizellomyces punctatus DAOM BR117]|uniref:Centrosomal protein of 135 kDa n=1 Tax=Spizellomyces punctatus (strain DAOM BR117) TaxID=645134 RepID=A0A0L0H4C3_SPIPD|nr:uncharacterized protein SPPG_08646 [Spizellomyces punctatus DAOM BR117]KNC96052.1 hypothetical protein SPPG_08646 [Spizellomyces punctatus DAOM BR117]|eukprot:XP_016604092.1 hypothetical protein SPPG_08646 [Spizellomyces punctatus DAOM BR117]
MVMAMTATAAPPLLPQWRSESPGPDCATLRHRLEKLGYKEYLPPDAVPLVRKLLADLVVTTETCRKSKIETDKWKADAAAIQAQVSPLRSEISRLTAENNHLHHDIVRLADERDAREKRTAQAARRFESQTADLRFVASQYAHRVEVEQQRVEEARAKTEEALAKLGLFEKAIAESKVNAKSTGKGKGDAAARAEKLFQRLQKIDIETGLEPLQNPPVHFPPPDPMIADMVKLAEGRIANLGKAMDLLSAKNLDLENELDLIRKKLENREQEMERLGAQLEIARAQQFSTVPLSSGTREGGVDGKVQNIQDLNVARQRIEQLEMQLEYLQEHVEGLEKEISAHDEEKQNLYATLDAEKQSLAQQLARERDRTKGLMNSVDKLERMVEQNDVIREKGIRQDAKKRRSMSPEKQKPESDSAEETSGVTAKANANEERRQVKRLQDEVEALKNENARLSEYMRTRPPEQVIPPVSGDSTRRQEERDPSLPQQIQKLKDEKASLTIRLRETEAQKWALETDFKSLQGQIEHASKLESELVSLRTRAQVLQRELATQQIECNQTTRNLEVAEKIKDEALANQTRLATSLDAVQRERDDLILVLQKFEMQLTDVQSCVEIVTADRDNIAALYTQVTEELHLLRSNPSLQVPKGQVPPPRPTAPPEPSAPVLSPETGEPQRTVDFAQWTDSQQKIRQLEEEVQQLQQDLKAAVHRQREIGTGADDVVQHLHGECESLRAALAIKERDNAELQDRLRTAEKLGENMQLDAEDLRRREEALRSRISEMEAERDRGSFQVRDFRSKVTDLELRLSRATAECERFRKEMEMQARQLAEQRQLLVEVDGERDKDRAEMDRKCERIVELEGIVSNLQNGTLAAEQDIGNLREQVDLLNHHLNERDAEVGALRTKVENLIGDRDRWAAEAQRNGEEARNVGMDLAALTRENQMLNGELAEVASDRERLRAELAETERQVQLLDELVQAKDQERERLFAAYRKLVAEHERLDVGVRLAGEESNNMRMEVILRDKRVQQLQKALDEAAGEVTKYKIDLAAFEKQCNNLSRSLATAERAIRHLESDKQRLLRDIAAARDLALSLERHKEELQKQLTSVTLECERMQALIKKLETDREATGAQIRAERLKSERLEHLVAMERTRQFQTEKAAKDYQESKGTLEDQLQQVNQQQALSLQAMSSDMKEAQAARDSLKKQISQLEGDLARTREALSQSEDRCHKLSLEVAELKEQVANKQMVMEDLMRVHEASEPGGVRGKSDLERRIMTELENTKRQLKKYEAQIAQRFRTPEKISPVSAKTSDNDPGLEQSPHPRGISLPSGNDAEAGSSSPNSRSEGSALDDSTEEDPVVEEMLAKFEAERRHTGKRSISPGKSSSPTPSEARKSPLVSSGKHSSNLSTPASTTSTTPTSAAKSVVSPRHRTPPPPISRSGTTSPARDEERQKRLDESRRLLETIVQVKDALQSPGSGR